MVLIVIWKCALEVPWRWLVWPISSIDKVQTFLLFWVEKSPFSVSERDFSTLELSNQWNQNAYNDLTHFQPMFHFYTPWKNKKTGRFLMFSMTCNGALTPPNKITPAPKTVTPTILNFFNPPPRPPVLKLFNSPQSLNFLLSPSTWNKQKKKSEET